MKILVLNCGSSSIKFQLFDLANKQILIKGVIERIGVVGNFSCSITQQKRHMKKAVKIITHRDGVEYILKVLTDKDFAVIGNLEEIDAVGHRVVHGGEKFCEASLLTEETIKEIQACIPLAPLHNPANLDGITACREFLPDKPQVAVFDTAFHQTIPSKAYLYGLPYAMYEKHGLRKYGFHGISHFYVANEAAEMMNSKLEKLKIITCHLGNGASIAAIKDGKSLDTSMGFTPLEGLLMGTRCGEIDPAVVPFLMEKEDMTGKQVSQYLNEKSGVLGLSGISSDFRDLEAAAARGDDRARLAIDVFVYRVQKYIGGYILALGGLDAIVFTAGIGENSPFIRQEICRCLQFIGAVLDDDLNEAEGCNRLISTEASPIKIFVIPTNEEFVIAKEVARICQKTR